jgi:hypothetical protein
MKELILSIIVLKLFWASDMANTWVLDKTSEQLHQPGIEVKSWKADSVCQLVALSSILEQFPSISMSTLTR